MMRIFIRSNFISKHMLLFAFCALLLSIHPRMAIAQLCGTDYVVKKDETLASIAAKIYGNSSQWKMIFYANQDRLGNNATLVAPGLSLRVPCIGQPQDQKLPGSTAIQQPDAMPQMGKFRLSSFVKRVEFLTAEGYAPLTGRDLQNGGMMTEIISASMELIKKDSEGEFNYRISWVNDWASHLNPLLISRAFDVGFPWEIPDCDDFQEHDTEGKYRCEKFFYSEPLYEIFEVLYVRKDSPSKFESADDVIGKKICLTVDNDLDDVDGGGRNWAKDGKVTLIRPASLQECFTLLEQRAVDGVVASEMTGIVIASTLGIADKVKALPQPLNIQTVGAIVSKTHPQARVLLYYVNTALAKLKESGDYDRIVDKHLSHFWATYDPKKSPLSAHSVRDEKPDGGSSKPEQSDSHPPQRGVSDPKTTSQARK
jgi:polar amino acid transport system substrate-binding protein